VNKEKTMAIRTGTIQAQYQIIDQFEELSEGDQLLMDKARGILNVSYSPYSKFQVGSSLILDNGIILTGTNQENASYPLCICAERVALYHAGAQYPDAKIISLAVTARSSTQSLPKPVSPCGACRQVITEFESKQKSPIRLILMGDSGQVFIFESGRDLLPLGFDGSII
jgi:cytidine deaminase